MRITQLRRPLAAVASSGVPNTTSLRPLHEAFGHLRIGAAAVAVEGRRYASVKSQGAYKLRDSSTIPKKLGAKKTGDSYVIPGNIIYKQRGTKWYPGENCHMGRDHTIHAAVAGYVKYYRDPERHPKRQFIGVVFDKSDVLPYPRHAVRKRRLNMTVSPITAPSPQPEISPSGIPTTVVREGYGRAPSPRDRRVLKLQHDGSYAYREENWRLGTLVRTDKRKLGSRRVAMRRRRQKQMALLREMQAERRDRLVRRKESADVKVKSRARRLREYRRRQAEDAAAEGSAIVPPQGGELPPSPPPGPLGKPLGGGEVKRKGGGEEKEKK
ncbi:ribosomal L27 protein-domain-containing protein [Xylariomycetidae sp. FL0641]|nr:ribosomal L27 protein-domain-containing protein [Xylariomycetidae sp. FL0641]